MRHSDQNNISKGSWAGLNSDLLQLIVEKIAHYRDFLQFGVVCTQWRSIILDNLRQLPDKRLLHIFLPRQYPLPVLLGCNDRNSTRVLDFCSVTNQMVCEGFSVSTMNDKWVCGSSNGWIVTVDFHNYELNILNPFTKDQMPLPSHLTYRYPFKVDFENKFGYVQKVVVLSSSSQASRSVLGDDCIVTSIISKSGELSFCRLGDDEWKYIEGSLTNLVDAIPYKGQIYTITCSGIVVACDVTNDMKMTLIAARAPYIGEIEDGEDFMIKRYLVESTNGALLQVVRVVGVNGETCNFIVYRLVKLDESKIEVTGPVYCYKTVLGKLVEQQAFIYEWIELETLGDEMLFLGYNCSASFLASLYSNCKGNRIYFSDDDYDFHVLIADAIRDGVNFDLYKHDMGIYDMEAKRMFSIEEMDNVHFRVAPVWVVPNLW